VREIKGQSGAELELGSYGDCRTYVGIAGTVASKPIGESSLRIKRKRLAPDKYPELPPRLHEAPDARDEGLNVNLGRWPQKRRVI
jgi:hypothetical protein